MKLMKRVLVLMMASTMTLGTAAAVYAMPSDIAEAKASGEYYGVPAPTSVYWDGAKASWNSITNAVKYQVQVYRNGAVASTDTTSSTHMSYRTLLNQSGYFTFRVRSVSATGSFSDWSDYSPEHHISGFDAGTYSSSPNTAQGPGSSPYTQQTASYGWVASNDGFFWLWKNQDGTFAKNTFKTIDGSWYYFDNNGYMFTGWFSPANDQSRSYYFYMNGRMATGMQNIDGMTCYFNDDPSSPYYGCRQ